MVIALSFTVRGRKSKTKWVKVMKRYKLTVINK